LEEQGAHLTDTDVRRRNGKLLSYLINRTLAGEESQIKGYSIAIDVFGRPEDFDPQSDSIVRVQAGRLRKALALYYHTDGQNNPVRIELPVGRYIPVFSRRDQPVDDPCEEQHRIEQRVPFAALPPPTKRPFHRYGISLFLLGVVMSAVFFFTRAQGSSFCVFLHARTGKFF